MSFQSKTPPIKLTLDEDFYNLMIETLIKNEKIDVNSTNKFAKKLKDKLLRYGFPYKTEDGKNAVKVGFYNGEASEMISQLLIFIVMNCNIELLTDYYSVLVKVREANKEQKEN